MPPPRSPGCSAILIVVHPQGHGVSQSSVTAIAAAEQLLRERQWAAALSRALPWVGDRQLAVRARAVIANASAQLGDHAEAVLQFRWLRDALPAHAGIRAALSMALNNLGSLRLQDADTSAAETHYRDALAVDERNPLAWFNLAACAQARNDFELAARAYARATELDPGRTEARLQWALCERVRGAAMAARSALRGFDTVRLPAELAAKVGAEWDLLGDPAAAARAWAQADDGDAGLLLRIAQAQLGSGDVEAARTTGRRAAARAVADGTHLRAALVAALGLPAVASDRAEIVSAREGFASGVAELRSHWPAERLSRGEAALDDLAHSHYLLAYQGEDDRALAGAFGEWYGAAAMAIAVRHPWSLDRAGTPRHIALVAARWTLGTISAYFGPWIGALRGAGWHVEVVHIGAAVDAVTQSIAASASHFQHLPGPLDQVVAALQAASPAVILYPEIGLSPRIYPLAALRLAPLQLAAWGHPVSSGLASIDGWLSSAEMEPDNGASHYRERLHLLPGLGTRYARPSAAAAQSRAALGLPAAARLYLAPHAPVKIHPDLDTLLVRIANADRDGVIVMFEDSAPALTQRLRRRLQRQFDQHGLDLDRHLHWLPRATPERFREVLAASDVLLDTPGFSGGNTSLDAIAQGLPLVALPGPHMRSRQSAAMLRICGCPELVASSADAYVDQAVRVANESACAAELRERLRDPASMLFEDRRPLDALVALLDRLS